MSKTIAPILVVSPHLDDAVLACGEMLAAQPNAFVCTVFAGCPSVPLVTKWDARCGFSNAQEAVRSRIDEDTLALRTLNAVPIRLGFLDAQYLTKRDTTTHAHIVSALRTVIQAHAVRSLFLPLGLSHSDHELAHEASRDAWLLEPTLECFAYEDGLYRCMRGVVQRRLVDLALRGITATPVFASPFDGVQEGRDKTLKRQAVAAYASQLGTLGADGDEDFLLTERFWKLDVDCIVRP